MSDFKKLDDLPKIPNSYEQVMKAMAELHRLVTKQAKHYGGKNSKLFLAQVTEAPLLQQFADAPLNEDLSELKRLLDVAHDHAEDLLEHLESTDDSKGLRILGQMMKMIGLALKESSKSE